MIKFNNYARYIVFAFIAVILAACSGGNCPPDNNSTITISMDNNNGGITNGAVNVSRTPSIVLQFSVPMDPTTINSSTIILSTSPDGSNPIPISNITADSGNSIFHFSPLSALNEQTKYYVIITSKVKSAQGASVNQTIFNFTTGDFTSPMVSIISPINNATNVSQNPMIQIQFSEPVQNVNGTTVKLYESGSDTPIVISNITAGANNTYNFSPLNSLNAFTKYVLVLESGIVDNSGNALIQTKFSFNTGDSTAPMVLMRYPSNNSTNVSLTPILQFEFSESVLNVESNTTLHKGGPNGSVVAGSLSRSRNNIYQFIPTNDLESFTTYYLVFSDGITDLSGNHLNQTVFNFTTGTYNNIYFSPIIGNHPGNTVTIQANTYSPEFITVHLPDGFRTVSGNESSFTCYANLSCSESVAIAESVPAGYQDITATGSRSLSNTVQIVPVAVVKQFSYITMTAKSIELCNFESTGFTNCSTEDFSGVTTSKTYGTSISPDGLYGYIMTGGDGIYQCNIDQVTKNLTNCAKQASTNNDNVRASAISTNGKYFYYDAINSNSVNRCDVARNGNLSNCVAVKSDLTYPVERITLDYTGNNIFVNTGTGNISCKLDNITGEVRDCIDSGATFASIGLSFNLPNSMMYFTGGSSVSLCNYNRQNQTLSSCTSAASVSGLITGIGFSTQFAFLSVAGGAARVKQCNIDNNTGLLTGCIDAPNSTATGSEGITVFN